MDSGRLFFDTPCQRNMLLIGNVDPFFRGPISITVEENSKKRPFFSSPGEIYEEEYYEEQLPEKKRRLTAEQVNMLEKSFEEENKLEPERKSHLATKLGLQPRQVAVWFQNRRARWKTKQLERDYDHLKASYDSLLSDYDSIRKENEKLKSEIVSMTEKLQAKEVAAVAVSGPKSNPLPAEVTNVAALGVNVKVEDRLSTGSGGSAVVDEEGPQLVDSGDSCFLNVEYPEYVAPVDAVRSQEDDGSSNGQNYFSDVFMVAEPPQQEEGEPLGWWVWA